MVLDHESPQTNRARHLHFLDAASPNPIGSPRVHVEVQVERSLEQASAISFST
jgi:hypothetical protein